LGEVLKKAWVERLRDIGQTDRQIDGSDLVFFACGVSWLVVVQSIPFVSSAQAFASITPALRCTFRAPL